jgi:hypothetical protein
MEFPAGRLTNFSFNLSQTTGRRYDSSITANMVDGMKKYILTGFLILFLSQLNVFAKQPLNSEEMSKQIKEVNGNMVDMRIKLSESIIEELNRSTDPGIILSMKSIHSFTVEYSDFLEYERTLILMYPYLSESVKLYFSGRLRDNLKQKKKEISWFMESFSKHESNIKNSDILLTIAQLRKYTEEGQMLIDQLINYYSSEHERYKQDNR